MHRLGRNSLNPDALDSSSRSSFLASISRYEARSRPQPKVDGQDPLPSHAFTKVILSNYLSLLE